MPSQRMLALLGLLAVAGYQNRDRLKDMLGNLTGQNASSRNVNGGDGGIGGLLGGLGNMVNDVAGNVSGALGDLVGHFSDHGQADAAQSWVKTGPNRDLGPRDLEQALGEDTLAELGRKTGLSKAELVSRLSTVLPSAVDRLTPDGRLPTIDEETPWAHAANG